MTDPLLSFREKTGEVLQGFKKELGAIRTSRPTPAILDGVKVGYYGQTLSLNQVGSIAVEPPRDIVVHVWDTAVIPELSARIEKAASGRDAADGKRAAAASATADVATKAETQALRKEIAALRKQVAKLGAHR